METLLELIKGNNEIKAEIMMFVVLFIIGFGLTFIKISSKAKLLIAVAVVVIIAGAISAFFISKELKYSDDDKNFCKSIESNPSIEDWQVYIENYPNGKCVNKAKKYLRDLQNQKEDALCKDAQKEGSFEKWNDYLEKFPEGKCKSEANNRLKKLLQETEISCDYETPCKDRESGLFWSKVADKEMNLKDAEQYCEKLEEVGYDDWILPSIDELRTLIRHCPKTAENGECKVRSEGKICLDNDCRYPEESCSCNKKEDGRYNKLKDGGFVGNVFWSASVRSDGKNYAWYIDFADASINEKNSDAELYVRCTRRGDKTEKNEVAEKEEVSVKSSDSVEKKVENEANIKDIKSKDSIKKKQWSSMTPYQENWHGAKKYCQDLEEDGWKNWRLPTIDELRTLIKKCEKTQTGGTCKVTNKCLQSDCSDDECIGCPDYDRGNYSEYRDRETLWSSSTMTNDPSQAWVVNFAKGSVDNSDKDTVLFVRCIKE